MSHVPYKIVVQKSVVKMLRYIPQSVLRRMHDRIAALADTPIPSDAVSIRGYNGYFRVRVGDYRIVYAVTHEIRIVTIIRIGHRKGVYKGL